jgi:hypothetical protein
MGERRRLGLVWRVQRPLGGGATLYISSGSVVDFTGGALP